MKYLILVICVVILAGCGVNPYQDDSPPELYKEIRCTYADGKGRYGTLLNYVKGDVKMAKITTYGEMKYGATCSSDEEGMVRIEIHDH